MRVIEERQGLKISCPEEIAFRMGYIDRDQLGRLARKLDSTRYGRYLSDIAREPDDWFE